MANIKKNLKMLFGIVCIWTSLTILWQAFQCPKMTDTERFLRIPQSFILNFKHCNE